MIFKSTCSGSWASAMANMIQEANVCSHRGQGRAWLRPERALCVVFRFYLMQLHLEDRLSPMVNLSFLEKHSVQQVAFTRLNIIFYVLSVFRHDDDKVFFWIKATFIRHHTQVGKLNSTIAISTHRTANLFPFARFDLGELNENICMI